MITKRISVFILFLILSISAASADASSLDSLILHGKQQLYHFQLRQSIQTFRNVQKYYPRFPQGYFYEAYVLTLYYSQDETNEDLLAELNAVEDKALEIARSYLKKHPNQPEAHYYLGVTYGLKGIYHVLERNYLKGYIYGRKAKNYLNHTIEIDSTYTDAMLGLGIFHYYVDLLPGVVKFFAGILGFHGDRARGMREIRSTMKTGKFFHVEAEFVYATIRYFLEGDISGAMRLFNRLEVEYPDNPALTLVLGYHYRRMGNIRLARQYFNTVDDTYLVDLPQIFVIKQYNLGVCAYLLNDFKGANRYFNLLTSPAIRKSPYYVAALSYYKGLLAKLNFREEPAWNYFRKIPRQKNTQYWYHISRFWMEHSMDSTLYYYVIIENDIFTGKLETAWQRIRRLDHQIQAGRLMIPDDEIGVLLRDLKARYYFRRGRFKQAADIYRATIPDLNKVHDKFQRAWVYINYAKVLRYQKKWKLAEEMLDKARVSDDEYTRIIIEREKFILKRNTKSLKS